MELALATPASNNVIPMTAAGAAGRRKSEKNAKFANDCSWASVENMLKKFAFKAGRRLADMGLSGWDEEEIMAQLRLGYVQALNKFDATKGILFSTYCFRVCVNNFNDAIKKQEREREQFGMISYEDIAPEMDDGDDHDPLESMREGTDVQTSAEEALVAREEFQERMRGMSQGARRLITALLTAERIMDREPAPKLRELAASCGLQGDELRQVKQEILQKFGVRWN